jgi:two-component system, OmpR family, sensor kinase
MRSLRGQLLAGFLALYAVSVAATILLEHRQFESNVSAYSDGQMHALALSYAGRVPVSGHPPPVRRVDAYQIQHHGAAIVQLWDTNGKLTETSWPFAGLRLQRADGFRTLGIGGSRWRVFTLHSSPLRVQVITSDDFRQRVIWDSTWDSAKPILYLTPLTMVLLWLIIHLALRPTKKLVRALSDQDERHPVGLDHTRVPSELLPLVDSMNGLLARVREAFESQQRFVADAAHELRTPLTALKLQIENLREKVGRAATEELAECESGLRRLQRVVQQLLQLSRQEAPPEAHGFGCVGIECVVGAAVRDLVPLAEAREIDLGLGDVQAVAVRADAAALRIVLDNLMDNALRYTPRGGRVDVSARCLEGTVVIDVSDTGPGIPADYLDRVFDRFYRIPGSEAQGSGLGLAISRVATGRLGGSLELFNRGDASGLTARLRFPVGA